MQLSRPIQEIISRNDLNLDDMQSGGMDRQPRSQVPYPRFRSQEMHALDFEKREDPNAKHGGDIVIMALPDYQNAGLDVVAETLANIWISRKTNPTSIKAISTSVEGGGSIATKVLVKSHLKCTGWRGN